MRFDCAPRRALVALLNTKVNYEQSPPPAQPRLDPDAIGRDPAFYDGHPHDRVHVLFEFLLMGCIRKRIAYGLHRCGNVVEDGERIEEVFRANKVFLLMI